MTSLEGHSTVIYKDTLYIFGGIDHQTGLLSNCTWSLKVHDALSGGEPGQHRAAASDTTATLTLVKCRGHLPPPRCFHACTLRGPFMVVTGGETGSDSDARDRRILQANQFHKAGMGVLGTQEVTLFDDEDDDVISNPSDDEGDETSPSRKLTAGAKSASSALIGRVRRGSVLYTLNLETLLWSRHHLKYSFESHDGWVLRTQQELKKLQAQQHTAATNQSHSSNKVGGPKIDASNLIRLNQQALLEAGGFGSGKQGQDDDTAASLALAQATDTVLEAAGLSFTDMALAAVKRRCHATLLSCPETIYLFGGYPIEHSKHADNKGRALNLFDGMPSNEFESLFPSGSRSMYNGSGGGLLRETGVVKSRRLKDRPDSRAEVLAVEPSCFYRLFEMSGRVDVSAVDTIGSVPMLWGHSAVRCHNSIVVFGGIDARGGSETAALCVYSLEDRRWRWVDQHLTNSHGVAAGGAAGPTPRALHTAVLHKASMLVHGGFNTSDPAFAVSAAPTAISDGHMNDTWSFSLNTGQWEMLVCTGEVPPPRSGHTAMMYEDCMLVIGGLETRPSPPPMDFPPPGTSQGRARAASMVEDVAPSMGTIGILDTYTRQWRIKALQTNVPMSEALRQFVPLDGKAAGSTGREVGEGMPAGLLLNPFALHASPPRANPPTDRFSMSPSPQVAAMQARHADNNNVQNPTAAMPGNSSPYDPTADDENAEIFSILKSEAQKAVSSRQTSNAASPVRVGMPGAFPLGGAASSTPSGFPAPPVACTASVPPQHSTAANLHGTSTAPNGSVQWQSALTPALLPPHIAAAVMQFQPQQPAAKGFPPKQQDTKSNVLSFRQFTTPHKAAVPIEISSGLDEDEMPQKKKRANPFIAGEAPKQPAPADSQTLQGNFPRPPNRRSSLPLDSLPSSKGPATPTGQTAEERKARLRAMRNRNSAESSLRTSPFTSRAQSVIQAPLKPPLDAVDAILTTIDDEAAAAVTARSRADRALLEEAKTLPAAQIESTRGPSRARAQAEKESVRSSVSMDHTQDDESEGVEDEADRHGKDRRSSSVHSHTVPTRKQPARIMSHNAALGKAPSHATPSQRGGKGDSTAKTRSVPSDALANRPEWNTAKSSAVKAAKAVPAKTTPSRIVRPRRDSNASSIADEDAHRDGSRPKARHAPPSRAVAAPKAHRSPAKTKSRGKEDRADDHEDESTTTATDDYLRENGMETTDTDGSVVGGAGATSSAAKLLAEELAKLQRLQQQQQQKQMELQRRQRELMERLSPRSARAVGEIVTSTPTRHSSPRQLAERNVLTSPPHVHREAQLNRNGDAAVMSTPRPRLSGSSPASFKPHTHLYNPYRRTPTRAEARGTAAAYPPTPRSESPTDPYLRFAGNEAAPQYAPTYPPPQYTQQQPPPIVSVSPRDASVIDFHDGVEVRAVRATPPPMLQSRGYHSDTVVPGQGMSRANSPFGVGSSSAASSVYQRPQHSATAVPTRFTSVQNVQLSGSPTRQHLIEAASRVQRHANTGSEGNGEGHPARRGGGASTKSRGPPIGYASNEESSLLAAREQFLAAFR